MRFSFHDSRLHQCPLITLYGGIGRGAGLRSLGLRDKMAIVVPSHLITSFSGKLCKRDGHFIRQCRPSLNRQGSCLCQGRRECRWGMRRQRA